MESMCEQRVNVGTKSPATLTVSKSTQDGGPPKNSSVPESAQYNQKKNRVLNERTSRLPTKQKKKGVAPEWPKTPRAGAHPKGGILGRT